MNKQLNLCVNLKNTWFHLLTCQPWIVLRIMYPRYRRYRKSLKTGLCLFYCVRSLLKKLILNRSLMNNFQTMVVGVTIFWYFVLVSLEFIFIPFQTLILMFSTSSYLAGKCFMIIYIFFSSFLETPPWKQKRSISPKW